MKIPSREFIGGLLVVNCKYNYKVGKDGKCHSNKCMLNRDVSVSKDIKEKGCLIYKEVERKKNIL